MFDETVMWSIPLQDRIRDLSHKQDQPGAPDQNQPTPTIEMFDFKAKFAEAKATAKVSIIIIWQLNLHMAASYVCLTLLCRQI